MEETCVWSLLGICLSNITGLIEFVIIIVFIVGVVALITIDHYRNSFSERKINNRS